MADKIPFAISRLHYWRRSRLWPTSNAHHSWPFDLERLH